MNGLAGCSVGKVHLLERLKAAASREDVSELLNKQAVLLRG